MLLKSDRVNDKMIPWYKRKRITSKNQIGLALLFGAIFALMGLLGSYSANFLYKLADTNLTMWYITGFVALSGFFSLIWVIIKAAKKYF